MESFFKLNVDQRDKIGNAAARSLRRSGKIPVNYYNAVLGLTLKEEWIDEDAYMQLKCKTCTLVGFGKAKNDNNEYLFIVFDSQE